MFHSLLGKDFLVTAFGCSSRVCWLACFLKDLHMLRLQISFLWSFVLFCFLREILIFFSFLVGLWVVVKLGCTLTCIAWWRLLVGMKFRTFTESNLQFVVHITLLLSSSRSPAIPLNVKCLKLCILARGPLVYPFSFFDLLPFLHLLFFLGGMQETSQNYTCKKLYVSFVWAGFARLFFSFKKQIVYWLMNHNE